MWLRPDADIKISTPVIPLNQSVDYSVPATADPGVLSWSGTDAMNPIARLTDTSSMTLLQDWIVIFAVGLGIGGGMLASLLFEWLRPRPSSTTPQPGNAPVRAQSVAPIPLQSVTAPPALPGYRFALAGIVLIFAWACTRRTVRRP